MHVVHTSFDMREKNTLTVYILFCYKNNPFCAGGFADSSEKDFYFEKVIDS